MRRVHTVGRPVKAGGKLPAAGRKKVLAGGVFNIIHPGHIHFLREAKELGDELVVVVANDKTVVRNNKRLLFPAKVRAQNAKSVAYVDRVVVGDEKNQMKIVKKERPDVIAIGYDQDYDAIKHELVSAGIRCRIKRISKLKDYSTKKIMEMME